MNSTLLLHGVVLLFGVLIACFSQILLKKAAVRKYSKWYWQYLNFSVIAAYAIMVISTLCSTFAYRVIPLSTGPIWTAAQQLFMVVLTFLFLGERPTKRKLLGLCVIMVGVLIFII